MSSPSIATRPLSGMSTEAVAENRGFPGAGLAHATMVSPSLAAKVTSCRIGSSNRARCSQRDDVALWGPSRLDPAWLSVGAGFGNLFQLGPDRLPHAARVWRGAAGRVVLLARVASLPLPFLPPIVFR